MKKARSGHKIMPQSGHIAPLGYSPIGFGLDLIKGYNRRVQDVSVQGHFRTKIQVISVHGTKMFR